MVSTAILCSDCRRVVAVGASLPATCYAAVPISDRDRLSSAELDAHPAAHHACMEFPVLLADDALADEVLADVEGRYQEQIATLSELAKNLQPEEAANGSPGTAG